MIEDISVNLNDTVKPVPFHQRIIISKRDAINGNQQQFNFSMLKKEKESHVE